MGIKIEMVADKSKDSKDLSEESEVILWVWTLEILQRVKRAHQKNLNKNTHKTHLPNLVSPKVVLRLSDRALILFLSFCKLSEVLKYIYMSNKNRERSRRY